MRACEGKFLAVKEKENEEFEIGRVRACECSSCAVYNMF